MGTLFGASVYDGTAFCTYTKADGLADNYVNALLQDRHGDIWIGTAHGVSRYMPPIQLHNWLPCLAPTPQKMLPPPGEVRP